MILDEYLVPVSCKRLAIGGIGFCATSRQIKIINSVIDRVTDRSYHFLMRAFRNGTDPILITDTLWPVFWLSCILFPCPLSFTFILIPGKHMSNTYFICPAIGNRHRSVQKKDSPLTVFFLLLYVSFSAELLLVLSVLIQSFFPFLFADRTDFHLDLAVFQAQCSLLIQNDRSVRHALVHFCASCFPVFSFSTFNILLKTMKTTCNTFSFWSAKKESRRSLIFRNTIFSFGLCRVNCSHIIIRGQELFYRKTIRVTEYGIKDWV